MAALKKYDPKQVTITWLGQQLNIGISEGTFVAVTRAERNSSLNVGGDGRATMVINNNRSGTIAITYRAGSSSNDYLTDRLLEDEADPETKNVGPLVIQDFSGATLHSDPQAFLNGPPDDERGTDENDREWTFECPELTMEPRGNNDAAAATG
jgi:hypothetical protein